ncbi:TldD/PmbA family protein [Candidatus Proelusimicrobium volucris]|uniref:TldD/PmbA family protein n=1 Tax=Candidatus Proelusimicrobium volucris TaxID=3416225 RepID=UPI003D0DAFFD
MKRLLTIFFSLFLVSNLFAADDAKALGKDPIIKAMDAELKRSMKKLSKLDPPIYFLSYQINLEKNVSIASTLGENAYSYKNNRYTADIDARAGSRELDNTRKLKSLDYGQRNPNILVNGYMPSPKQIRNMLWILTEDAVTSAQEDYLKVKTNALTSSQREDNSNDFSDKGKAASYYAPIADSPLISQQMLDEMIKRTDEYSAIFKNQDFILSSAVSYSATLNNKYFVNSEGTKIVQGQILARLSYNITSRNKDGMILERNNYYDFTTPEEIPSSEKVISDIEQSIAELKTLQNAPAAEPFHGPVILRNRATGVFFHEILGHRVEGHRQKDDDFGQTFTNKINEQVISPLISVYDNPTMKYFNNIPLRGYYAYDDEGVASQNVMIIEKGVLSNFLMSRSPIKGFDVSNGHGRKQAGYRPVSRMGVTIVEAEQTVPFDTLKQMLKEEIKKQNKPYGLIIDDISGGFTMIDTSNPQAFKVNPLLVYKVYPDDRPDEIIRGADIVGTPLTSFNKIIAAANDYDVFNGSCGAESGWVPVSAIAPSVLISELEVERVQRSYDNLPILTPPPAEENKKGGK